MTSFFRIALLFSLLSFPVAHTNGQNIQADTAKIAKLLSDGQGIYLEKPIEAQALWEDGLSLCEKLLPHLTDDSLKRYVLVSKSDLLFNLSQIHRNQGEVVKTVQNLEAALEIDIELNNRENISSSYNDLGVIYSDMGLFEKALDYYVKSLQIDRELGNQQGVASSLINLGYLHSGQRNFEEALSFFNQSLDIQKKVFDTLGMITSYNNLASVHFSMDQYELSLKNARQSLVYSTALKSKSSQANSLSKIGNVFMVQERYDSAKHYLLKSLSIRSGINDQDGIFTSAIELANFYHDSQNLPEALTYGKLSYSIAQKTEYPFHLRESSKLLSRLFAEQGDYQKAYDMQGIYEKNLAASIDSDKSKQLFKKQFEAKYANQRLQDSLINLEKEALNLAERSKIEFEKEIMEERQNERNRRNRLFLAGAIIALILMLVIIYIQMRNNRAKQAANKVIAEQKLAVEQQKSQIETQHRQLERTHKSISDSIVYAKRLQKAIMPGKTELESAFEQHFVLFKPKDVVSGDFYWFHELPSRDQLIAVADCTGHGVPGAMVSIVCSNALKRSVREFGLTQPKDILEKTRELVIENYAHDNQREINSRKMDIRDGMDIALCKISGRQITYAGANNPRWVIKSGEVSEFLEMKPNKQPIGKYVQMKPFTEDVLELDKGDMLYMFSDGFADQFGGNYPGPGKKFKYKPFKELLIRISNDDVDSQRQTLDRAFNDWKGDREQIDDLCVMGIRI